MQIIKNISYNEYSKMEGLSKSAMDKIKISPAHYKASLEEPEKQTDALRFGSLLHCLVLEPKNYERDFAIEPIVNKRTNEGKDILQQFYNENINKTIISQEQYDLALKLKESIFKHSIAKKLLEAKGDTEISLFWERNGVKLKARPDKIVDDILIDLKTTTNASPDEFYKNANKYGYEMQAFNYLDGYENCYGKKASGFIFITVEKDPPYAVCVYKASENFLRIGKIEVDACIDKFAECEKENKWEGYPEIIYELDVPAWVNNKFLEEE